MVPLGMDVHTWVDGDCDDTLVTVPSSQLIRYNEIPLAAQTANLHKTEVRRQTDEYLRVYFLDIMYLFPSFFSAVCLRSCPNEQCQDTLRTTT